MTTNTSQRELEALSPNGPSCGTSAPAEAHLPDEPDEEEPIDPGRALADDADGDLYDAGNFKEELAMESEVRA